MHIPHRVKRAGDDGSAGPLLRADGVRKVYRSGDVEVPALHALDLTVERGELLAVMGPSGSGKTTLLNCLSGLDEIDAGHVLVEGHDLFAMSDAERTDHRARTMGFIFQAFNLIPVFSAAENVELPLLLTGVPQVEARERALAMLARVGLAHRAEHKPNEVSGGEQQRITIARALVGRPAIVWADEPTGNLDTTMAAQVMDLLCELNADEGQTIVLVTHDPGIGQRASRCVTMVDGRLVRDVRRPAIDLTDVPAVPAM
ncbi:ABC transporter ATP-binding protein [Humibacter sp.]|uniref:ABC transporter ATP-binding protein n=1 Tax=Humibacter sp. TaxID=1940291 RepID=UPI002C603B9A|nr:ABC transporter ATP-binding protein [Humibacter sp.]HVX08795.1 ABC transporter ATP-binding protein [Humibacter sp.]